MRWRARSEARRRQAALDLAAGLPRGRVLDAPCGAGELAQGLAALGHEVWAADRAAEIGPTMAGVRFDQVDLERPLPYPDGFFAAVFSLEGIEHLDDPAGCLREFARVLGPGGRLILTTPNINNVQARLEYLLSGRFSGFKTLARAALRPRAGPVSWHVTPPYLPTLAFHLTGAGLRLEALDTTMIKTRQWLLLPLALPMWLAGRRAPAGTVGRALGSWRLLLGRNVVVVAVKPAA